MEDVFDEIPGPHDAIMVDPKIRWPELQGSICKKK